jgi:uncharacterized protein YbjQ (UPF0145 family)
MGLAPVQLVMATSVYSLGFVGGWGSALRGMSRGEIPELTSMVYDARHNCIELLRKQAAACGAEQVIGNKLAIRELGAGLVEVMAVGTAVRARDGLAPATGALAPQAIIVESAALDRSFSDATHPEIHPPQVSAPNPLGCLSGLVGIVLTVVMGCAGLLAAMIANAD